MKYYLVIFSVLFSSLVFSQSAKKRIARGKQFFKMIRVREVLDTMLWKEEAKIFNNTELFFKKNNLDSYNSNDYRFFQSTVMQQFLFSKRHILDRIKYKYEHFSYEKLGNYIKEIKQGRRTQVIYSSGLYDDLKKLLTEEIQAINTQMVPKYLEIIVKRHRPVDLNLSYNGKKVKASDLDLDVLVKTKNADYKKISILDRENNQLKKPEGYTYDQIQKIIVVFKGQEFEFKPDSRIFLLPRNLMQVNNPLSRYSFEEIPEWNIDIKETNGTIGIRLTNVVEANVVKTKSISEKKIKKIYR